MHVVKLFMYHSPNRWGESHKTAATLIKARFLTLIVGDRAKHCSDIPSTVPQPPEILKASTLWVISNSHHVVFSIHDHSIACNNSLKQKKAANNRQLSKQNLTKQY